MINYFTIPDSYVNFEFNLKLLQLKEDYPEFFIEDRVIESAYGCPNPCIWNGNRLNRGEIYSVDKILLTLNMYKKYGVNYRFTFTNTLLEPVHLLDTFGNTIATLGESTNNGVIVSLSMMKDYIKEKYPKYQIINSIVPSFIDTDSVTIESVNKISENEMTVLPLKFNNKWDELKNLKFPDHIEVLQNQPCIENCPRKYSHYEAYNKYNLGLPVVYSDCFCKFKKSDKKDFGYYKEISFYVSSESIEKYNELGINHFKIAGRDAIHVARTSYLDLFIKEKYRKLVENYLSIISYKDVTWRKLIDDVSSKSNSNDN